MLLSEYKMNRDIALGESRQNRDRIATESRQADWSIPVLTRQVGQMAPLLLANRIGNQNSRKEIKFAELPSRVSWELGPLGLGFLTASKSGVVVDFRPRKVF
jgi:hypothetical protein